MVLCDARRAVSARPPPGMITIEKNDREKGFWTAARETYIERALRQQIGDGILINDNCAVCYAAAEKVDKMC